MAEGRLRPLVMAKPDIDAILGAFPKRVPVFPLSEVVLFPGAVLPLHIFEPRYREMLDDAVHGDRIITMALLKQCDAEEYAAEPPYYSTVCVGHVIHHDTLEDGRSNIALLGLSAGRAAPADSDKPYRVADVELLRDTDRGAAPRTRLQRAFTKSVPGEGDLQDLRAQLEQFLDEEHIESALVNTCALTAPVFPVHKLELLEERDVHKRLDRLLEFLERRWQWN